MRPLVSCGVALLLAIAVGCGGGDAKDGKKAEGASATSQTNTKVSNDTAAKKPAGKKTKS